MTTTTKRKVLIKQPGKQPELIEGDGSLEFLQGCVGGPLQLLPLPQLQRAGVCVWINEEGKLQGLQPNKGLPASFGGMFGDYLCGPIVFTGELVDEDTGEEHDVSMNERRVRAAHAWLDSLPEYAVYTPEAEGATGTGTMEQPLNLTCCTPDAAARELHRYLQAVNDWLDVGADGYLQLWEPEGAEEVEWSVTWESGPDDWARCLLRKRSMFAAQLPHVILGPEVLLPKSAKASYSFMLTFG